MRIPHGIVALMGWLAVICHADLSAATQQKTVDQYDLANFYPVYRLFQQALGRGDYAEAFRIMRPWADHNERAAYEIGLLYADGKGVPQDMAKARTFMERAAKWKWFAAYQWLQAHGGAPGPSRAISVTECAKGIESTARNKYDAMSRVCPGLTGGPAQFYIQLGDVLYHQYGDGRVALLQYKAARQAGSPDAEARIVALNASPPSGPHPAHDPAGALIVGGTVCDHMADLDGDTRQFCRFAVPLCSFAPGAVGVKPRGNDLGERIRNCVADAYKKASAGEKQAVSLSRCKEDADHRPTEGIHSCAAVVQSAANSHQRAIALSYEGLAYANRGYDLHDPGMLDRSISDANRAIAMDSSVGEGFMVRGIAREYLIEVRRERSQAQAIIPGIVADFTTAISFIGDRDALELLFLRRGDLNRVSNHPDRAIRDYGEAIKLNRQNAHAYYWRGMLERQANDLADANRDIDTARRIDPSGNFGS